MIKKPKYIKKLEKNGEVLSIMNFHTFNDEMYKLFEEKKIPRVFEKSIIRQDGKAIWDQMIYKTNQNFYLHVINTQETDKWWLCIYYRPEQFNELIIFIRSVLKQLRDATINDRSTETKN